VWDAPTRLVHWLFVFCVAFSWWTVENDRMDWHYWSGLTLLGLLVFRIYWGFAGPETARFAQFVKGPGAVLGYVPKLLKPNYRAAFGHNPLGALSVVAILGALITQVTLGLFALLATLVWPKIIAGLDERYAKIKSEIDAAEKARHEAESAQKKFEDKLRQAQEEATRTIADAQAMARKVAEDLRAKNDAELTEMKTRALADIQSAREAAVKELNDHAVSLAATMASKILRREVSAADQSRLVTESLAELSRARN
jgi:ATP synthase F0 subunit b